MYEGETRGCGISIHSPRMRGDMSESRSYLLLEFLYIFFPPPSCEGRLSISARPSYRKCFYTLPSYEGRRDGSAGWYNGRYFYTLPPRMGGDHGIKIVSKQRSFYTLPRMRGETFMQFKGIQKFVSIHSPRMRGD